MAYQQEISRQHTALCVILLDESYSMEEPIGGNNPEGRRKMDAAAAAINSGLMFLVTRCTGSEGVRHWWDVAVIGYRTDQEANPIIESRLGGSLADLAKRENRFVFSITEIGENSTSIEHHTEVRFDEATGEVIETLKEEPIWVEPKAEGGTPMCSALRFAYDIIDQWIQEHEDSFPPMVIHINDGESQEGDPLPYAVPIMELDTCDGPVLLFNCYLATSPAEPLLFPHSDDILPDQHARVLFQMSSIMPEPLYENLLQKRLDLQPAARCMAVNDDMFKMLFYSMTMGTRGGVW